MVSSTAAMSSLFCGCWIGIYHHLSLTFTVLIATSSTSDLSRDLIAISIFSISTILIPSIITTASLLYSAIMLRPFLVLYCSCFEFHYLWNFGNQELLTLISPSHCSEHSYSLSFLLLNYTSMCSMSINRIFSTMTHMLSLLSLNFHQAITSIFVLILNP